MKTEVTPELIQIVLDLNGVFDTHEKIAFWINTKNNSLGGLSPIELIERNRGHKVQEFIDSVIEAD